MARNTETPRRTEQLRDDIDSGRTGDKVPASDPAAVPLGADQEAAGTPVAPESAPAGQRHRPSGDIPAGDTRSGDTGAGINAAHGRPNQRRIVMLTVGGVLIVILLALAFAP